MLLKNFWIAARLLALMTVLTGVLYTGFVTVVGQLAFHDTANGSLVVRDGQVIGSRLIGQSFTSPRYFWSRPSATSTPYDASASSGSNYGPLNADLKQAVEERVAALHASDPEQHAPIPVDLVTTSGSGLDPHISVAAALYQAPRVARVRGMPLPQVRSLIERHAEGQRFGFLGEPRINVLVLNLALEGFEG